MESIYGAGENKLLGIIEQIDEKIDRAMLVGHNPGFTYLANLLSDYAISNLPTSGVFGVDLKIDSWPLVGPKCGRFKFFEYPKKYAD